MHKNSMNIMNELLTNYLNKEESLYIADIGSLDVNGTYKTLIPSQWTYTGYDIAKGNNVDIVMSSPFSIPAPDKSYDVVLCGQVIEHCCHPFRLMEDIYRITKDNGYVFVVAPSVCPVHRYPKDYWRIFPDGMKELLTQSGFACLNVYESPRNALKRISKYRMIDCVGIGKKAL